VESRSIRPTVSSACRSARRAAEPGQGARLDGGAAPADQHLRGRSDQHRATVVRAPGGGQVHREAVPVRGQVDEPGGDEEGIDLLGELDVHGPGQHHLAQGGVVHRLDGGRHRRLVFLGAAQRMDVDDLEPVAEIPATVVGGWFQRALGLDDGARDRQCRAVTRCRRGRHRRPGVHCRHAVPSRPRTDRGRTRVSPGCGYCPTRGRGGSPALLTGDRY
jgi:hypothetical protein